MNEHNEIIYTDEPIGKIKVVKDFLPNPRQLAKHEKKNQAERLIQAMQEALDYIQGKATLAKTHKVKAPE